MSDLQKAREAWRRRRLLSLDGLRRVLEAERACRSRCDRCREIREKERPQTEPLRALVPDLYNLYLKNGRLINCSGLSGEHDKRGCVWK